MHAASTSSSFHPGENESQSWAFAYLATPTGWLEDEVPTFPALGAALPLPLPFPLPFSEAVASSCQRQREFWWSAAILMAHV